MNCQIVEMVAFEACTEYRQTGAYAFDKNKKFHWLQRLCIKVLDKIGARYMESFKTLRFEAKPDAIMDKIVAQIDMAHMMQQTPVRVFVGSKNWPEIASRQEFWRYMEMPAMTAQVGFKREYRVLGLDVTIVPWMDGVLVLPAERG